MQDDRERGTGIGPGRGEGLVVWLLQHGEPLPIVENESALRTARLARVLASRGHAVTYWCSSLWHHRKEVLFRESRDVKVAGYTLRVLHAGSYQGNRSLGRYVHHRRMAALFAREARARDRPDVIVAGLPIHYCAFEAVRYGRENGVPVIVDIRDYWPDVFLMMLPKRLHWVGRIVFRRDFAVARAALRDATSLVSMMTHMLEWGARQAGRQVRADDKVFLIGGDDSTGSPGDAARLFPELAGTLDGRFVVSYIGGFGFLNHPGVIVEAARHLRSLGLGHEVVFLLAGKGDYHDRCVKAAKGLDNVVFLGWLDAARLRALISISSVGVIPSIEEFSFPNKAFSCLGGGLPLLSSAQGDLRALLEEYDAGSYFDISDPAQLANRILDLSRLGPDAFRRMSDRCKALFREHLRAEEIYKAYADHVERVAAMQWCAGTGRIKNDR